MRIGQRGIRNASIVLGIALILMSVITVYEATNYGHRVKWEFSLGSNGYSDDYYSAYEVNDRIYVCHSLMGMSLYVLDLEGEVEWSLESIGSRPAIDGNGTVYVETWLDGDDNPSFCAYDADGSLVWSYPVANGSSFHDVTIGPEGNVYSGHEVWDGDSNSVLELIALSPGGELLWNVSTKYAPAYILCQNGTLLIDADSDGNTTGLGPDGSVLWTTSSFLPSWAVLLDQTYYYYMNLGSEEGIRADICAVDLNGILKWRYPDYVHNNSNALDMICWNDPIMDQAGNVLFVRFNQTGSEPYDALIVVSPEGELLWEYRDAHINDPATYGDTIIISTSSGLVCLDLEGEVRWKEGSISTTPYHHTAPSIGSDGTIYVSDGHGIVAIGDNLIVLYVGAIILVPIIMITAIVLWISKKNEPESRG